MIKQIEVTVAVMLIISIFSGIEIYLNKRIENMKEGISKISSWKHLKNTDSLFTGVKEGKYKLESSTAGAKEALLFITGKFGDGMGDKLSDNSLQAAMVSAVLLLNFLFPQRNQADLLSWSPDRQTLFRGSHRLFSTTAKPHFASSTGSGGTYGFHPYAMTGRSAGADGASADGVRNPRYLYYQAASGSCSLPPFCGSAYGG